MKPVTYLCFTLLSIAIQFCLMDFINERRGSNHMLGDNNTSSANNVTDLFKVLNRKPHALYYPTEKLFPDSTKSRIMYNYSITEVSVTTTEISSVVFDLLYDENVSMTDSDSTTDTPFTSSQFDNVTEITLLDKKPSNITPSEVSGKKSSNKCDCNLLYKACDTNCCCDDDCTDLEKSMLKNCDKRESTQEKCDPRRGYIVTCSSQLVCNKGKESNIFGYFFCIAKVNLPEEHVSNKNIAYVSNIEENFKWHITNMKKTLFKFTKDLYVAGTTLWILRNGTIHPLTLPIGGTNGYCNEYKAAKFLLNENIKCYVKFKDLQMFRVLETLDKTNIVSPKNITLNSTKVDCNTLYCANWTFLICDHQKCDNYEKELHSPMCSESYCDNIVFKIEYEFYCNVSLILRATIKFHVRRVATTNQFFTQEITVNFYMGNESIENVVKFSGNPGYIRGLPIIASFSESNHTQHFYNCSSRNRNLIFPYNNDGECILTNLTYNTVKFGHNKRMKCRVFLKLNNIQNGTEGCFRIQEKINELLGLSQNVFISPYGNPQNISDRNWITIQKFNKSFIYGEYKADSKLLCYNVVPRVSYIVAFVQTIDANKDQNTILRARIEGTPKNITFNIEAISIVITVDTNFVNATKRIHEDVAPHLNFHLPKDFFFPIPSNECRSTFNKFNVAALYLCTVLFMQIK